MRLRTGILLIATLAISGLAALLLYVFQRESLLVDGQASLPSLQHSVQVHFDSLLVPYIEARSEQDMIITQGYITAAERLFQMDILRRIAKGEMAAIFGSGCLAADRLSHKLGFKRLAEAEYRDISPETKAWLKLYCQGVNTYISQNKNLPLEFTLLGYEPQPWEPTDTLSILRYLQYACDECWPLNILQASISKKAGSKLAYQMFNDSLPTNPQSGGNAWAVPGKLSQSQGSLLACNKNTIFTFPDLFFASSLHAPLIHVAGFTIPGIPGIIFGRNEHIAWTSVNQKVHTQDLRIQEFSDQFPSQSKGSQGWLNTREFQEEISQRFGPNIIERILITKDGPLLTKDGQTGVALSWYGFSPNNGIIESVYALNKAKNWADFEAALKKYKGSPQIFLYADTTGNIAEQEAGYSSYVPQTLDKLTSCIVANGSEPAGEQTKTLLKQKLSKKRIALDDMAALQADCKASLTELVRSTIKHAITSSPNKDKYQQEALSILANWDGQLKANSSAACIYEAFLTTFTKAILKAKIGDKLTDEYINNYPYWTRFTRQILEQQPAELLPPANYDFAVFTSNCFAQALKDLRLTFSLPQLPISFKRCQWQFLHQLDMQNNLFKYIPTSYIAMINIFLPQPIGLAGDQDCINSCNYQLNIHPAKYTCTSGSSTRLLIDMADNDKFYQSLTYGQYGRLFSSDKMDSIKSQLKAWHNVEFHALAFSPHEINRLAHHTLTLNNDI